MAAGGAGGGRGAPAGAPAAAVGLWVRCGGARCGARWAREASRSWCGCCT